MQKVLLKREKINVTRFIIKMCVQDKTDKKKKICKEIYLVFSTVEVVLTDVVVECFRHLVPVVALRTGRLGGMQESSQRLRLDQEGTVKLPVHTKTFQ